MSTKGSVQIWTHTQTHAYLPHLLLCICTQSYVSIMVKKGAKLQNQWFTHRRPSLSLHFSFALWIPPISIMHKWKEKCQNCLWHLYHLTFFEGANRSVYLTKFMKAPLLKRRTRKKRSRLNNKLNNELTATPACAWGLVDFLQAGEAVTMGSLSIRDTWKRQPKLSIYYY